MLANVERVSAEEVQALARKTLDPAVMGLTVLGNLNGVRLTRADLTQ